MKIFWSECDVEDRKLKSSTLVVAIASDGARLVMGRFSIYKGVVQKPTLVLFYAHGPAGVVDWMESSLEAKREYEKLAEKRKNAVDKIRKGEW